MAQQRARDRRGTLVLRNEDLDRPRCKPEFVSAMFEDLKWFGFEWQEGPDCGGPFDPYSQSERMEHYRAVLATLRDRGLIYPCTCSRRDILNAASAPHEGGDEPIYPGTCRPSRRSGAALPAMPFSWRFQIPDGEIVRFNDGSLGPQQFDAGKDFGDFVVWRHDDVPAYQLAVVADDSAMRITEVVRGADLLVSTARQTLLYRALGVEVPSFFHAPLMTDDRGVRLAKRHDSLSLRKLREAGASPDDLRTGWV
jgi:glutamyl-tRNA synthetase